MQVRMRAVRINEKWEAKYNEYTIEAIVEELASISESIKRRGEVPVSVQLRAKDFNAGDQILESTVVWPEKLTTS